MESYTRIEIHDELLSESTEVFLNALPMWHTSICDGKKTAKHFCRPMFTVFTCLYVVFECLNTFLHQLSFS